MRTYLSLIIFLCVSYDIGKLHPLTSTWHALAIVSCYIGFLAAMAALDIRDIINNSSHG